MSCSLMTAASSVAKPLSMPSTASATDAFGSASACGHDSTGVRLDELVIGEHVAHAFARAFAPQRDGDALAGGLQRGDVATHRLEHIGVGLGALGGEVAALPRADVDHVCSIGHGEGGEPRQRAGFQAFMPFTVGEVEPVRRQRLVGRRRGVLQRIAPRLVIIRDRRQPFARSIFGQRLGGERACPADNRTKFPACRGTAAANAPCRDSGGLRSPLRRADRQAWRRRTRAT